MARTYGLGGAGLAGAGLQQKNEAMGALSQTADMESERQRTNKQLEEQRRAGNAQLGSTLGGLGGFALGAKMGAAGGPVGALIGGIVGAIAGKLF